MEQGYSHADNIQVPKSLFDGDATTWSKKQKTNKKIFQTQ